MVRNPILQQVLIMVFMFSTLGGTLVSSLIYLDFELRREYIARMLCEKKDEPMTICRGQCILSERLDAVSVPEESDQDATVLQSQTLILFSGPSSVPVPEAPYTGGGEHTCRPLFSMPSEYLSRIFIPPRG